MFRGMDLQGPSYITELSLGSEFSKIARVDMFGPSVARCGFLRRVRSSGFRL